VNWAKQRNQPAVGLNTAVHNLRQLLPDKNCEYFAHGEGEPWFGKAANKALNADMQLVSLLLTRFEHGLQTKCVFGVQGECGGNVVPSCECGEPRKLTDEAWEVFGVPVNGCAGEGQSEGGLWKLVKTSFVFSQFISVFLWKCHGDREWTFSCWVLHQVAWRFGFANAMEPEVKVEAVELAPPSFRIWGAVSARALPWCADTEHLARSCYCNLDCPFEVLSCLVVLALTLLLRGKGAKNLWSSKSTFSSYISKETISKYSENLPKGKEI